MTSLTKHLRWLCAVDEYARRNDLDPWATRIVVAIINFGPEEARKLASPNICAWSQCLQEPRSGSIYCSLDCSNKNARWRYQMRRQDPNYDSISHPVRCYQRLQNAELLDADGDLAWTPGIEPWESDPILWVHTLSQIANGAPVPYGLPTTSSRSHPHLRVVNGGRV